MYRPPKLPGISSAAQYSITLDNFKGVDFSSNLLNVSKQRSPDALNMIAGTDGFPVSRSGYSLFRQYAGHIYGMHTYETSLLVHSGKNLYLDGTTPTLLYADMNEGYSSSFQINGLLYILDGKTYLQYDGTTAQAVVPYVPTTVIGKAPSGGGTSYESVNMLTKRRINSFLPTGSTNTFYTDVSPIDNVIVEEYDFDLASWVEVEVSSVNKISGQVNLSNSIDVPLIVGYDNVRITFDYIADMDRSEDFQCTNGVTDSVTLAIGNVEITEIEYLDAVTGWEALEDYSLNDAGVITFPLTVNFDDLENPNLKVTYNAKHTDKTGYINACDKFTVFGLDTVFFAGETPNRDWHSEPERPNYITDTSYSIIGDESSAIMGYLRLNDGAMAIIKEKKGENPSIYYRTRSTLEVAGETVITYPLSEGSSGVGAVSSRCFKNFLSEPLFLSESGVFAVGAVTNSAVNERYAKQRSYFINPRLTAEQNLDKAHAAVWGGFYYLCVNSHCYVADSRQRTSVSGNTNYEWYYWDDVPATVFYPADRLYFGTADGKVCVFDGGHSDLGEPFSCYWATPLLNCGTFTRYKNLKNAFAVPSPYVRSGIKIDYIVKGVTKTAKETSVNIFDFEDVDFEDFTFDTDTFPRIVPTGRKEKKFTMIMFKLSGYDERPFGLYAFTFEYTFGAKYKGD